MTIYRVFNAYHQQVYCDVRPIVLHEWELELGLYLVVDEIIL